MYCFQDLNKPVIQGQWSGSKRELVYNLQLSLILSLRLQLDRES